MSARPSIAASHPRRTAAPLLARAARPESLLALSATLVPAAGCWALAVRGADGMGMGVQTSLGSLPFFAGMWVSMMAAMMLPGAAPAVTRSLRREARPWSAGLFLCAYLAVWTLAGLAVYALYRPHSTSLAGALVLAAGLYELTPLKRRFRRRCHESERSGVVFGIDCLGSSIGLMLVLLAVGAMSIGSMAAVAGVVVAQKLLPQRAALDVPLALAIVALGLVILTAPSAVPGLAPAKTMPGAAMPAIHAMPGAAMPAHATPSPST